MGGLLNGQGWCSWQRHAGMRRFAAGRLVEPSGSYEGRRVNPGGHGSTQSREVMRDQEKSKHSYGANAKGQFAIHGDGIATFFKKIAPELTRQKRARADPHFCERFEIVFVGAGDCVFLSTLDSKTVFPR